MTKHILTKHILTKHILTKHILMALAMAAMVPAGQAWADTEIPSTWNPIVDSTTNTLTITPTGTVTGSADYMYKGKYISDYSNVIINYNAKEDRDRPLGVYSERFPWENVNVIVHVTGNFDNNDALHLTNHYPNFNVRSFQADVTTGSSDGINLSHDITSNGNGVDTSVTIGNDTETAGKNGNGDLTLTIKDGSGIRANASCISENVTNSITVKGTTTITINGNTSQIGVLNPTAVYAGADSYYNSSIGDGETTFVGIPGFLGINVINTSAKGKGVIELQGDTVLNLNGTKNYGLWAGKNGKITANNITINAIGANSYGVAATNGNITWGGHLFEKDDSQNKYGSSVILTGQGDNRIIMHNENNKAIYAEGMDDANQHNMVSSGSEGIGTLYVKGSIEATDSGLIDLIMHKTMGDAQGENTGIAFYLKGAAVASENGTVKLQSAATNVLDSSSIVVLGSWSNPTQVVSALYADNGTVNLTGANNKISSTYTITGDKDKERTLWARNKGTINVYGQTSIEASNVGDDETTAEDGEITANNRGIAIAAGMDTITDNDTNYNMIDSDRSQVNIVYSGSSSVTGDIAAGYGGKITISANQVRALANGEESESSLHLTGNALAANGGIVNIDLGNGGSFTGRADDYGDAGSGESSGHGTTFFNPAFSNEIKHGGAVNFTMGEGSTWKVKGQSWITSIDTRNAAETEDVLKAEDPLKAMENMATIDLVSANTDQNQYAHALTVYEMQGDAVFNMSLDGNRDVSDMLYMKNAKGAYIINVVDPVTLNDMYARRDNGELFNGLRFATVGKDSDVTFRAVTIDQGVLNVEYEVGTDSYDNNEENEEYNSTAEDGTASGNSEKPGDAIVDGFFESDGTPVGSADDTTSSANYMVLSETDAEADIQNTGAINYKLIGRADEEISSAGKAIVAMSKVNYSNAVYMDRLNKRMGEARYIDGDDGLWVRLRHDRIGKEDAFRSMNTMFELGYDRKVQDQKDGEHRRGVAFDYMRGEADYTNVMGSGDVRRAGVWLYDTWLGDKGHYSDYVLKYGHLSNDFDIFAPTTADKISGDYDNDVWSASAEYGRKKDIGNEWYFEPQAQLQYAYVTSADYTTSQNTKVSLDGIDSLIGRAGFRLGRDTSEGNTVYFKADILHEFLGDQRVHASDITGALDTTYDNEGTWYDVGFGFSHRMGEDSYMFLDVEHSFGNDNEDTYQINIGLNRAF